MFPDAGGRGSLRKGLCHAHLNEWWELVDWQSVDVGGCKNYHLVVSESSVPAAHAIIL